MTRHKSGASNPATYLWVNDARLVGGQKTGLLSRACQKCNYDCEKSSSSDFLMSTKGDFSQLKTAFFRKRLGRLSVSMTLIWVSHFRSESGCFSQVNIAFFRKAVSLRLLKAHRCTSRILIHNRRATDVSRKNVRPAPMTSVVLILASERTAARLLDMKPGTFRDLVKEGVLPKPLEIGGLERWDVEQLKAIVNGRIAEGAELIEW